MAHPKLVTGRVGIYARYSTDRQNDKSNADQIRRAREAVAAAGGDPNKAQVFADTAVSATSMERPDFERMMGLVKGGQLDILITEDVSRMSRDFADAAIVFRQLQYLDVPLIGIADGIDTSAKHAKVSFGVKSLVADMQIDDIRDKTLRGLQGRALDGFATGNVPFGYRTVPTLNDFGRSTGSKIEIDEFEAPIVVRIFTMCRDGIALNRIAKRLNAEGVRSPRAGSRHKRFGWGQSTVRAMLHNEKYIGVWRFNERQWVKVPGTAKRIPRKKAATEVMVQERPDLRIVSAELWDEVKERLAAVRKLYTRKERAAGINPRATQLLTGVLICDECSFPLTIYGDAHRYYRCYSNHTKGTCSNTLRVRADLIRTACLDAIRDALSNPEHLAQVRRQVAEKLGDHGRATAAELKEHRDRLARTEERIGSLISFIASGEKSEYVTHALRDQEAQARADRAAIERLTKEAQMPLRLPSVDEISAAAYHFDQHLAGDPGEARTQLQRWLKGRSIRIVFDPTAPRQFQLRGEVLPLVGLGMEAENENFSPPTEDQDLTSEGRKVRSGGRI
jgi:site-specific DNA recombinase